MFVAKTATFDHMGRVAIESHPLLDRYAIRKQGKIRVSLQTLDRYATEKRCVYTVDAYI
jgi:hypothetical protein